MKKEVIVLGGTGFLGYYTVLELLKKNYKVSIIALPPLPANNLFPSEVEIRLADMNQLSDEQIISMLKGKHAFVYAAGADERVVPTAPAMKFFYQANVIPTQRAARLATQAGIKKFIVYGSYFAHFAEQWHNLHLRENAPYVRNRLLQEEVAYMEGEGSMDVCTLRLPYIFGTIPGRMPLWTMFTENLKGKDAAHVYSGGTAMITVQQVAEAAIGAIENGQHRTAYPIGEINMKYSRFNEILLEEMEQLNTKIEIVTVGQTLPFLEKLNQETHNQGKEHGIDMITTAKIQELEAYIDPAPVKAILGYNGYNVEEELRKTIRKCIGKENGSNPTT